MRIAFNWPIAKGHNGPSSFLYRLAEQLRLEGVSVVSPAQDMDIYVVFIQDDPHRIKYYQSRGVKVVQRLDNIYFDSGNTLGNCNQLNAPMKAVYDLADKVVFQSEFSSKLIQSHFGKKDNVVIHNGIKVKNKSTHSKYQIACSSSWRRHKRLQEIIDIFLKLDSKWELIVAGKPDVPLSHPRICYTQFSNFEDGYSALMDAKLFLHLCWFDSCPNAVVEALSLGIPVICGNQGGTQELVRATQGGLVAPTDQSFDFGLVDLYNPPPISGIEQIIDYIESGNYAEVDRNPIMIEVCARKYIGFFRELLAS